MESGKIDSSSRSISLQRQPEIGPQPGSFPDGTDVMVSEAPRQRDLPPRAVSVDPEIRQKEIELHERYYVSVDGVPAKLRCLSCADTTHSTINCPAFSCTICSGSHTPFQCKYNKLCSKCRQRGHPASECTQKLLPTKAELSCDICGSPDHYENRCHLIWRSFIVKPEEIRPRANVPVYCYECGGQGHYGGECGISNSEPSATWVRAGRKSAVAPRNAPPPERRTKDFSIKGKANDPILLEDSDDDVTFIRPKINNAPVQRKRDYGSGSGQQITLQPPKIPYSKFDSYDQANNHFHGSNGSRPPQPGSGFAPYHVVESARYGRERSFSPPPENETFMFDAPYQNRNNQNGTFQFGGPPPTGPLPTGSAITNFRGGASGRGGRGGGGRGRGGGRIEKSKNNGAPEPKKKKVKATTAKKAKRRGQSGA